MRAKGEKEKALELLKQCKSLSPRDPDILNEYGEFLEEEEEDIIEAEHHYALALVFNPDHSRAKSNRMRTLPLVKELDMEMLKRIENKRDALAKLSKDNILSHQTNIEAYYQYIYPSNRIKRNTMTLPPPEALVETGTAVGRVRIMEQDAVLGINAALKYINNTLLYKKTGVLGVEDVIEIHRRVLGFENPEIAGHFRAFQVYVSDHVPPPATDVNKLMEDFDDWLCSKEALMLHPIEIASLSHYKLVYIHPFLDGNGRTAMLFMNLLLMEAGYLPVIIRQEQRFHYNKYLKQADLGDVRPFIRFFASCMENTLDEHLSAVIKYPNINRKRFLQGKITRTVDGNEECINPSRRSRYWVTIANQCFKVDREYFR